MDRRRSLVRAATSLQIACLVGTVPLALAAPFLWFLGHILIPLGMVLLVGSLALGIVRLNLAPPDEDVHEGAVVLHAVSLLGSTLVVVLLLHLQSTSWALAIPIALLLETILLSSLRGWRSGLVQVALLLVFLVALPVHFAGPKLLVEAVSHRKPGVVRALLSLGLHPEDAATSRGITALHRARAMADVGMMRLLLDHGANPNPPPEGSESLVSCGWTTQDCPACESDLEAVRLLLDRGAHPDLRDGQGRTPLFLAVKLGRSRTAHLLVERGADVNARDAVGKTALFGAVHLELARLLVERGADVGARDHAGRTALFDLAGSTAVVEFLLGKGADLEAKDHQGRTALFAAVSSSGDAGNTLWRGQAGYQYVEFLVQRGADVNVRDAAGRSPLDLARSIGRRDLAELLAAAGAR